MGARILLTICFAGIVQIGQCQQWLDLYQSSVQEYESQNFDGAMQYATEAYTNYRETGDTQHKNAAVMLRNLAVIADARGDYDLAIEYAKAEVKKLDDIGVEHDEYYADALDNLSLMLFNKGDYAAAQPYMQQALEIFEQSQPSGHEGLAICEGNYAVVLFQLGKNQEARRYFEASINVLGQAEEQPLDFINIAYHYALLEQEEQQYESALNYFQALEDYYAQLGGQEYINLLLNMGSAHSSLRQFEAADQYFQKAIQLGETDPNFKGDFTGSIATNYQKQGKFNEAEKFLLGMVQARKAKKDIEPLPYAMALNSLAKNYLEQGNLSKASENFNELFTLYNSGKISRDTIWLDSKEGAAILALKQNNYELSSQYLDEAVQFAQSQNLNVKLAALYRDKANVFVARKDYDQAQVWLTKNLTLLEKAALPEIEKAKTASIQGLVYTHTGDYQKAESRYQSALPTFRAYYGQEHPEYARLTANYSSLLQIVGKYPEANRLLKQSLAIKAQVYGRQSLEYLNTYENLALLYISTARYGEASTILTEVKQYYETNGGNKAKVAATYKNLSRLKRYQGDFIESEKYIQKAIDFYESNGDQYRIELAHSWNELGMLYLKMGNTNAALPRFNQAGEVLARSFGQNNPEYASYLQNLASLYEMQGNLNKAKALLEQAREIDRKALGEDHPLYANLLHNLAAIHEHQENYTASLALYEESLAIEEKVYGKKHPSYATTLFNLAVLEQELERNQNAYDHYLEAMTIRKEILGDQHPDYNHSIYGLASINQRMKRYEEAKGYYIEAIDHYLDNIEEYFPALSESEKSAFYARIKPIFEAFQDFAVDYIHFRRGTQQDQDRLKGYLYDVQLSTKALLLTASNKVRSNILNSNNPRLINAFQQWIALKEQLVKAYSYSLEELEANEISIEALKEQVNGLEKALTQQSLLFASTFENERIEWQQVKQALKPNEAALEVIRIKKNLKNDSIEYVALILDAQPNTLPRMVLIPEGRKMEGRYFKYYQNNIQFNITDELSFDHYWKEIDQKLGQAQVVYLSLDGVYNKLSLNTLYDPNESKYLFDKYHFRFLSNTSELVREANSSKTYTHQTIALFGFPDYDLSGDQGNIENVQAGVETNERDFNGEISDLPGTLEEINNIEEIVRKKSWESLKYHGARASEGMIKDTRNPRILHVATHGYFLEDIQDTGNKAFGIHSKALKFNPLFRSGLLLAGAAKTLKNEQVEDGDDGVLTAYEAMNLNLEETELVVLSACETGLGEIKNGEGVYGLQRAFLVAGANNLIMSLWKVDDAITQELMTRFYSNWLGGMSKDDAFHTAVDDIKNENPGPYYWGAFFMMGAKN